MVNDNIVRNSAVVRNLDSISIAFKDNSIYIFKGSDVADFKIEKFGNDTKISILTIKGENYIFYDASVKVIYNDQEKLKSTISFEETN